MKMLQTGKLLIANTLHPRFQLAAVLLLISDAAYARMPISVPEPSILSLIAGALVVGIVAHRIKNGKK